MPKSKLAALVYGCALAALVGAAARAETATAADSSTATGTAANGTQLQEVVVQARRTSESLQRVPVAVTVINQKAVDSVGAFGPQDLQKLTPGLSVPAVVSDINNVEFAIRGQSYSYSNNFNAVIPYYNDVPLNSGPSSTVLSHGQFFDLESIQVLRGPQGTQFGRVTDGGNVMIYPRRPSNSFDGYMETKLGDFGLVDVTGAVNVPFIADKLMVRAAIDINHRNGYVTNLYNGKDLNDVGYQSYRLGIIFKPTENIENYTSVAYEHSRTNGTAVQLQYLNQPIASGVLNFLFGNVPSKFYGLSAIGQVVPFSSAACAPTFCGLTPFTATNYLAALNADVARQLALGPHKVFDSSPLFDRRDNIYVVNTTTADFHVVTIKNIIGYIRTQDFEAQNFAGGNEGYILPCHSGCGYSNDDKYPFNLMQQFSEEFRLQGKLFNDHLTWSAGAYTDNQKNPSPWQNATLSFGVTQRTNIQFYKTWETAGYGNAEYDFGDFLPGLKVNGGIRYSVDSNHSDVTTLLGPVPAPGIPTSASTLPSGVCVQFPQPCLDLRATFTALTYTGGVSYQINPEQMLYAKVSRGYRPGGVNASAPPSFDPRYFPESDLSVEVGAKADFNFNGVRLRTDVALFHDNYSKVQQLVVLPFDPAVGSVSVVRNVDDAVIQGVEFEGTLIPVQGLTLALNYAYTDARYRHLPTDAYTNPTTPCTSLSLGVGFCSKNAFGFTPRNKVGLSFDYQLPIDPSVGVISFGGTWSYQSKEWLTTTSNNDPRAVQPAYSLLDLRAEWHQIYGHPIDLSFFMTNVTNKIYLAGTDDLESQLGDDANIYAPPRMFGFGIKYRFGASAGQ